MSIQDDYSDRCQFDESQRYGGEPGWYRRKDWNVSTGVADDGGKLHGTSRRPVCCPIHYKTRPAAEKIEWEQIP